MAQWSLRLRDMHGLKIGLAWAGNSDHVIDAIRSAVGRRNGTFAHTHPNELLGSVLSDRALFTRLDGEWWMLPHTRAPEPAALGE